MTTTTKERSLTSAKTVKKTTVKPTVGVTTFIPYKTTPRYGKHTNGSTAIVLFDPETEEVCCIATLQVPRMPMEGCVWLKTWDECDGVVDALIVAGIVRLTGNVYRCGKKGHAFEAMLMA